MRALTKSKDKGVAGLNVLLSIIVSLFVIGMIVMVFTLSGNEMRDATYDELTAGTASNETLTTVTEAGEDFTGAALRDAVCTITYVTNATGGETIAATNYTQTNCNLVSVASEYNNSDWNVSYTYTYSADNEATDVMNDTIYGIVDVTDWFSIIIVIGAMVVLILLTVIIITAIRGSGITGEGGSSRPGQNTGGTA